MGASQDEVTIVGPAKDIAKIFVQHQEDLRYEYGHMYSGTLGQKGDAEYVMCGTLPTRVTLDKFITWAHALNQWEREPETYNPRTKRYAKSKSRHEWFETVKDLDAPNGWRTVKHRTHPIPERYRSNPDFMQTLRYWIKYAEGSKWGPAGAVRLNKVEEKEMKKQRGSAGTRHVAIHIAGWCSS